MPSKPQNSGQFCRVTPSHWPPVAHLASSRSSSQVQRRLSRLQASVIIGETKASELLDQGYTFGDKGAESSITNPKNDHFYYGQLLEVKRDNQSFGFMSLTPTGKDTDQLKNCVITYYRTPKDNNQLEEISINHVKLANLKLQDFQTRKLIDIFEVNPADYNVSDKDNNFILTIQTADYDLWKRFTKPTAPPATAKRAKAVAPCSRHCSSPTISTKRARPALHPAACFLAL